MESNVLSGSYHSQEQDESSSDAESTNTPATHMDRKRRKPLMEKKRRARINQSLDELKKLVLDAMKKDSARYSKLEKADILELTVRHLREAQQQHLNVAMVHDTSVASKYQAGFNECASEVSRYLSTIDGMSPTAKMRLMQHLSHHAQRMEQSQHSQTPSMGQALHYQVHMGSYPCQGSAQPLQIQIPATTSPTSLPGLTRSPEPGTLPPTPPSDHSLNNSFTYRPDVIHTQFGQYPYTPQVRTHAQEMSGPLRGKENIASLGQRVSPYVKERGARKTPEHVLAPRKSSDHMTSARIPHEYIVSSRKTSMAVPNVKKENVVAVNNIKKENPPAKGNVQDEDMWRPW